MRRSHRFTGSDGAIYFSPPATKFCLLDFSDFQAGTSITVPSGHDFRVGDPVAFTEEGASNLDSALTAGTTYYVIFKDQTSIQVAATKGGAAITLNGDGGVAPAVPTIGPIATYGTVVPGASYTPGSYTGVAMTGGTGTGATADITVDAGGTVTVVAANAAGTGYTVNDVLSAADADLGGGGGAGFSVPVATITAGAAVGSDTPGADINIQFAEAEAVCQVSAVNLSFTRGEVDTTSLPCGISASTTGVKLAGFRTYQPGYAEGSGDMTVRFTADNTAFANRMIQGALFSNQGGAVLKVYLNAVADSTGLKPDDTASLLAEFPVSLLGFSFGVTPEDTPTEASINFRLSAPPTKLLGLN